MARQLEDGTWEIIDPPNYDLQYTLTGQYSPITGEFVGSQHSNPNLLDNWYFADPIDQRQGYVVPPDTPYYSDTGLTTQTGTVSAYTTATYGDGTYGTITVDSVTYYVAWDAAVRGYVGQKYMIDRFYSASSACAMTLTEDGVQLVSNNGYHAFFRQKVENPEPLFGQTVTLSVLRSDGTLSSNSNTIPDGFQTSEITLIQADFWTLRIASSSLYVTYSNNSTTVPRTYKAIKLELGSVQTLAHQDVDGNWVLNDPPPNKALELAKCQRYMKPLMLANQDRGYSVTGTICIQNGAAMATVDIDFGTEMRATPTIVNTFSGARMVVTSRSTGKAVRLDKATYNSGNSSILKTRLVWDIPVLTEIDETQYTYEIDTLGYYGMLYATADL